MNFGVLASTGPTMRNLRTPRHAEATVDRFNGAGARVPGMIRLVRHSIALVAAGLAAALSGCDSHNSGSLGADPRQVTVFGSGQVQGVPDTLIADVGIQVTAADGYKWIPTRITCGLVNHQISGQDGPRNFVLRGSDDAFTSTPSGFQIVAHATSANVETMLEGLDFSQKVA